MCFELLFNRLMPASTHTQASLNSMLQGTWYGYSDKERAMKEALGFGFQLDSVLSI